MIPLFKIFCPDNVGSELEKVFKSGTITEGEVSDRFEQMFSDFISNPYTSLTNACTSALTMAYRLCDLQPGDEVIATPMTCTATNEPILSFGARIVWADIDSKTGNIDPGSVFQRISSKTKAISAVHWAGQPFDIDAIKGIAEEYDLKIVEDCAHALGASYAGSPIGCHGNFSCFSFQAIKHLTTGDGGAISCSCQEDDDRIKKLRWFGLSRKYPGNKWEQDITEFGYKFHMNNLTATIGVLQMKHLDDIIGKHKSNGKFYDEHISNPHIETIPRMDSCDSAHWIYSLLVNDKDLFQDHMTKHGIASDVVHVRNDTYTVFKPFRESSLPGVDSFCSRMMNIPVGWWVSTEDKEHIVNAVNSYKISMA